MPRAQGQEITSTAMKASSPLLNWPASVQIPNAATAINTTAGTNQPVT